MSPYKQQFINFLASLAKAHMYLLARVIFPNLLYHSDFLGISISVSKMLFGNYLIIFLACIFLLILSTAPTAPNYIHLFLTLIYQYQLYQEVYSPQA